MKKLFSTNPLQLDLALLLLRFVSGVLMAFGHGLGKVNRFLSGEEIKFYDFAGMGPQASLGLAAFAEFVCAIMLVIGLFHRAALIPLVITMAVAAFGAHGDDPFGEGETAFLFLSVYVALFLSGPGRYALDRFSFDRSPR